ncbi:MAG: molybdopterin converting factor subunit 1 [Betaproteobacteria bacterium]
MKVKVLFFAGLREQLGTPGDELELPAGVNTVAALRSHLRSLGDPYERALSEKVLVRAAVNRDMAPPSARIKAGDEVAFFPPVTGG